LGFSGINDSVTFPKVQFNKDKISSATYEAFIATSKTPSVEDIPDIVESTLIDSGNGDIAKAYIVYGHRYNI